MRYLIKIGSALINRKNRIDTRWLQAKVAEIAALKNKGGEILLVSSVAVAAGGAGGFSLNISGAGVYASNSIGGSLLASIDGSDVDTAGAVSVSAIESWRGVKGSGRA